ncbi:hypothetical protein GCM10029978_104960 [Actinoallomurus acanthiterrae]
MTTVAADAGPPSVIDASDTATTAPIRRSPDIAPPEGSPDQEQIPPRRIMRQSRGTHRARRSRPLRAPALVTGPPTGRETADPR